MYACLGLRKSLDQSFCSFVLFSHFNFAFCLFGVFTKRANVKLFFEVFMCPVSFVKQLKPGNRRTEEGKTQATTFQKLSDEKQHCIMLPKRNIKSVVGY